MDETVKEIKERMKQKKKYQDIYAKARAKADYVKDRKNGKLKVIVPEYEKELIDKNKKLRGDYMDNFKRSVVVRLSKDFQVVEVAVADIDNEMQYELERDWAVNEAKMLINQVANQPTKQVTKKDYQETYVRDEKPAYSSGKVTQDDIGRATKFCKGGQKKVLMDGVNNGAITMDEVEGLTGWGDGATELQPLMKKIFSSKKR